MAFIFKANPTVPNIRWGDFATFERIEYDEDFRYDPDLSRKHQTEVYKTEVLFYHLGHLVSSVVVARIMGRDEAISFGIVEHSYCMSCDADGASPLERVKVPLYGVKFKVEPVA